MSADIEFLDINGALARVGGNVAVYTRLLKLFLSEDHMGQLNEAVAGGDDRVVLQLAHAFKGVCANLSMTRLKDISLEIETRIKANEDYKDCIAEYDAAYQKTLSLIHDYLGS